MSRPYWDHTTEALFSDLCDLLAQHLKSAVEEKPPYIKFEGENMTAHNPGWLNAALIIVHLISSQAGATPSFKTLLKELRDKTAVISKETKKLIDKDSDEDEGLEDLCDLYDELIADLDCIIE